MPSHIVSTIDQLEALVGPVAQLSRDKVANHLTPRMIEFIAASPMTLLGTANAEGHCDVTPRGDPPGSIQVLSPTTLLIAERRGNNRIDSLRNLIANPRIGMLMLVPGQEETLRINGHAHITTDPDLLTPLAMHGKIPVMALHITVEEAYMHCARAFRRASLWQPETWPASDTVPSMAAVLKEQLAMNQSVEEIAAEREKRYKTTLY